MARVFLFHRQKLYTYYAATLIEIDFEDELGEIRQVAVPLQQTGFSPYQYRKKVEAYIRAHENHITIAKLKRNEPLSQDWAFLE